MKSVPTYVKVQIQSCIDQLDSFNSNWSKTVNSLKELGFTETEIAHTIIYAYKDSIGQVEFCNSILNYLLDELSKSE